MERNKEFIIEALLDIQDNCKSGSPYNICAAMLKKGYDLDTCRYHLDLMDDAGYLKGTYKMMGANVLVIGLTNLGYDYIEKNNDDTINNHNQTTNINIYGNVNNSDLSTNKNGDFNNNSSETPSDAKEEGRKNRRTQIIVAIIGAIAAIACVIIPLLVNLFTKV